MTVEGPVIVDEHGDTEVYANASTAAANLEAIDVGNGEYEAFDSLGRPLDLHIVYGRVVLRPREHAVAHTEDVTDRLRRAARAVGATKLPGLDFERADLDQLIKALLAVKVHESGWTRLLPARRRPDR